MAVPECPGGVQYGCYCGVVGIRIGAGIPAVSGLTPEPASGPAAGSSDEVQPHITRDNTSSLLRNDTGKNEHGLTGIYTTGYPDKKKPMREPVKGQGFPG
jgi:hypothetical protein